MSLSPGNSSGIAVGVTLLVLFLLGVTAILLTAWSRRRQEQQDCEINQEQLGIGESESLPVSSKHPALPIFKTKSSLSKSPGGRFSIALPKHYGRRIANFEGLPSVESVLEKYEQDVGQNAKPEGGEEPELGEPGPAVPTESSNATRSVPSIRLEQV